MSRDVAAGGGGEKDNRDTDKNSERDSYVLPRRPGTFSEKFIRMWTEQPLIPLGAGATCYFLFNGLRAMKSGDKHKSQMMMRGRVAAQGFTVLAIFFGIFYKTQHSMVPPFVKSLFGKKED